MKNFNYENERTKCLKNIQDAFYQLSNVTSTDRRYPRYQTQYHWALEVFNCLCEEQGIDPLSDPEYKALMMEIKLRRF